MKNKITLALGLLISLAMLSSCVAPTESQNAIQVQNVKSYHTGYTGTRYPIVIGKFENKTRFHRGIFFEGETNQLSYQTKQILKTHLTNTNRFIVMDRWNLDELRTEAKFSGTKQNITGGKLVISGAVTEFGRRETGGQALGGILGGSRTQTAYAKVSISIIDVNTSQIIFTAQGAGATNLTNKQVLGFGSKAGYDATLTDKVLNLAIIEVIDRLVEGLESGMIKLPGASK